MIKDLERGLMLDVIQGDSRFAHIVFHVHKHSRSVDICAWLVKNKITGLSLYMFWKGECAGSYLELIKIVLSRVENDSKRAVIAGKDYAI